LVHTYRISDKTGNQLKINELKTSQCTNLPTVREFKKYLEGFTSVYSSTDLLIFIYYVSGYDVNKNPILIGLTFHNSIKNDKSKRKIQNASIYKISIVDIGIESKPIKDIILTNNRKQDFQSILQYLTFDGHDNSDVIIDSSSLQEMLDLRKSCKFTSEKVDKLVIDIYEKEHVVEKFLTIPTRTNMYNRVKLLIKLRDLNTKDYILKKAGEILTPEQMGMNNVGLLYTYTDKPTDRKDEEIY